MALAEAAVGVAVAPEAAREVVAAGAGAHPLGARAGMPAEEARVAVVTVGEATVAPMEDMAMEVVGMAV